MSWSFNAIGSPEKVAEAIDKHSELISKNPADNCRKEFDDAKPHLIALVNQNFVKEETGFQRPGLRIEASGSGSTRRNDDGTYEKIQSSVRVTIDTYWNHVV